MFGRHRSLDKALKRSIDWLTTQPGVTKVVIGLSAACRHKYPPGHLRYKSSVPGGIKINGYSGKGVTDFFIRLQTPAAETPLCQALDKKFTSSGGSS